MNTKPISYPIVEGTFLTTEPLSDQSLNILRYRDNEEKEYTIIVNRNVLEEGKTIDQFWEAELEKMKNTVPGFKEEGKNIKHELGLSKLPVLQTANKYLRDGIWVHQIMSIITLPYDKKYNPHSRKVVIFTLASNSEFTEEQRKHYVRIINSFKPNESTLSEQA